MKSGSIAVDRSRAITYSAVHAVKGDGLARNPISSPSAIPAKLVPTKPVPAQAGSGEQGAGTGVTNCDSCGFIKRNSFVGNQFSLLSVIPVKLVPAKAGNGNPVFFI